MEQQKVLTPSIAATASYTIDKRGSYYFVGSGGGGGGGYGITLLPESQLTLPVLLGILNSTPADYFLKNVSTTFANGYFAYNRQFIEQIPIPLVEREIQLVIESLVETLLFFHSQAREASTTQTARDSLMLAYGEQIVNGLVYELYFPDEVHGAGLRLYDLVEQARTPDINDLSENKRLSTLRKKFEELYDGHHPLRIALDKLQTLDTVRIIEGKA